MNLQYLKKLLHTHIFAFFTPGFDTISTTMTFMLYEIAKNPDVQAKARLEIEAHLGGDNDMTYETVAKMEYLNQVISGKWSQVNAGEVSAVI